VPGTAALGNRGAAEAGPPWPRAAQADPSLRYDETIRRYEAPGRQADVAITLEINEAWCKGCDICVKLCPERCLHLNAHQVAVLRQPEACTGCHVCEWLCPDFAITVRRQPNSAEVA